jgi:hypothetical protein
MSYECIVSERKCFGEARWKRLRGSYKKGEKVSSEGTPQRVNRGFYPIPQKKPAASLKGGGGPEEFIASWPHENMEPWAMIHYGFCFTR